MEYVLLAPFGAMAALIISVSWLVYLVYITVDGRGAFPKSRLYYVFHKKEELEDTIKKDRERRVAKKIQTEKEAIERIAKNMKR